MQYLIDAGANVNARDALNDATPLLMAVFRGQHGVAARLLTAGADPTVVSSEGDTALRWAAAEGDLDMARILLGYPAARATLELAGGAEGCTPLGAAARSGPLAMLELLLEAGADPATSDVDGYTALERLAQAEAEVGDVPEDFVLARAALTRARARATHAEPRGETEVVDPDGD